MMLFLCIHGLMSNELLRTWKDRVMALFTIVLWREWWKSWKTS
jgi:hypothetical protein